MSPDRFNPDETELAVEELVIKRNGKSKTTNDVFEVVVAMHHDSKRRDAIILSKLDAHCKDYVHFHPEELDAFVQPFRDMHAAEQEDIEALEKQCLKGASVGCSLEDEEMGDIRRAWRVARWFILGAATPFVFALGDHLAKMIWPD